MRLKPGVTVLVREGNHVQLGLSHPLAFPALARREIAFLASLEGRAAAISVAEREEFGSLVAALQRSDLLVEDRRQPDFGDAVVRLRRVDAITQPIATALALSGIGAMSIIDPRPVGLDSRLGAGATGMSSASALARVLRDVNPALRIAGATERSSLEVLRGHGALDVALLNELMARDIPHLGIVTDEEGIDVGPLVFPGATPCQTCLGIARAEVDSWWPHLALQLGGAGRDAGVLLPEGAALIAAGIAVREALGSLAGETSTERRFRVPFDGGPIEAVRCVPHPSCGCGAAGPVGDWEAAKVAAW